MSESLVLSLYKYFTIDKDGYIHLSPIFFPDGSKENMKFDSNFVASVNKISGIMNRAVDLWAFSGASQDDYSRIAIASMRMQAFVSLFNTTEYPEYLKDPFISQNEWTISMPKVTDDAKTLVHKNDAMKALLASGGTNSLPDKKITDNPLSQIQKTFGNILQEQITREVDGFRITNATMSILPKDSQVPIFFTISFKTSLDLWTVSEWKILYQGNNVLFSRDQYITSDFVSFFSWNAALYFQKISASIQENPGIVGDVILFIWDNRITIWWYSFNL